LIDISDYGYRNTEVNPEYENYLPARITAVHKERFIAICPLGEVNAAVKASVYRHGQEPFPTVGDFVLLDYHADGPSLIQKTLPRSSFFSRRDPNPERGEQAIAANFDYVFILSSLNRDYNLKRIERYLSLAWGSGANPVIILTKSDLSSDYASRVAEVEAVAFGCPVHAISVFEPESLKPLQAYAQKGKTLVFLGSSGVGKSTLVNALAGKEVMETGEIREDDARGRHTTTHRELFLLPNGAMVIDSPGMRQVGLWEDSSGLGQTFSDIEKLITQCRFSDCSHQNEPGCAVREALEKGELEQERWDNYQKLAQEVSFAQDKASYLKKKEEFFKGIAKYQKALRKTDPGSQYQ
jgi:ribosome biogenesis GTPase